MFLSAEQLGTLLTWPELIRAIETVFTQKVGAPVRHHHTIPVADGPDATLLLMPAWLENQYCGVKQVYVFPGNNQKGIPGLSSHYLLNCGRTGQPLIQMDGNSLTSLRTAAASALASSYLSRESSKRLLILGSGRMARQLIPAHRSVRGLDTIVVWDRKIAHAETLVKECIALGLDARVCPPDQLETEVGAADIISCATMSTVPLIQGQWLREGTHVDLVGSFTPTMREVDNDTMQRGHIFVDTRAGALSETGDLIIPIREKAIKESDVVAEFKELCTHQHKGRKDLESSEDAITVFKSVGDSREDLAAAMLAYEQFKKLA